MHFKVEKLKVYQNGSTLAFVDLAVMNGGQTLCVVKGFKVMQGQDGPWLAEPSQKGSDGKWYPTFYFGQDKESGKALKSEAQEAALAAYRNETEGGF